MFGLEISELSFGDVAILLIIILVLTVSAIGMVIGLLRLRIGLIKTEACKKRGKNILEKRIREQSSENITSSTSIENISWKSINPQDLNDSNSNIPPKNQ